MNSESIPLILSVASFTIALLFAIVGFMMKDRLRMNDEAIKSLEQQGEKQDNETKLITKKIGEVEMNYIDRFNNVERMISHSQAQVTNAIVELGSRLENKLNKIETTQAVQQFEINNLNHKQ